MDTVIVPSDRHAAHAFLAQRYTQPCQDRNFQWRLVHREGTARAIVRPDDQEVSVPQTGADILFEIEMIALSRTKGKRRYLRDKSARMAFIAGSLYSNAGVMITPDSVEIIDQPGFIAKDDNRFVKPAALFSGQATVVDHEKLFHALRRGIGQGKAFGYGLLIVKEL